MIDEPNDVTAGKIRQITDELSEAGNKSKTQADLEITRRQFDRNLFDRLGISIKLSDDELDRAFLRNYIEHIPEPGVFEMLDLLDKLGIKRGIVSNSTIGGRAFGEHIDELGLLERFQFLISSADYGFRKPHPQLFKTALAKLGTRPEETWFMGDTYEVDVKGAERVGMLGLWYNPLFCEADDSRNVMVIRGWKEFADDIASTWEMPGGRTSVRPEYTV